jgi:hypothetical protein
MQVAGAILPSGEGSRVNREAWCRLIDSRREFRRPQPRQTINPFTRQPTIIRPRDDAAETVVDGASVGHASWSMDEAAPLVNVSIAQSALPLVMQWAAELGGEFREDSSPAEAAV